MNKWSPRHLVVAAALFGIAAESAWSEDATSDAPATPADQATSPGAGYAPGYASTPYQGRYERHWQPPPWPRHPPGYYGHYRLYYPPYPQNRATAAAPAENPLGTELKQTQAQLASKTTELTIAMEQLANLQAEQQALREVMQQAQAETAKASEQLSVVVEEMDILYEVLSKLKARLDFQNTSLQGAVQAGAEENGPGDNAIQRDAEPVQSPAKPPVKPGDAGGTQTEKGNSDQAVPKGGQQI